MIITVLPPAFLFLVLTEPLHCPDGRDLRIDNRFRKSTVPLNSFFSFRCIYLISALLI